MTACTPPIRGEISAATVAGPHLADPAASAALGELCGRTARVEFFEGPARSGDVRAHEFAGAPLGWAPASTR